MKNFFISVVNSIHTVSSVNTLWNSRILLFVLLPSHTAESNVTDNKSLCEIKIYL